MTTAAVRVGRRSAATLLAASLAGLAMLLWPLLMTDGATSQGGGAAAGDVVTLHSPLLFIAVLPVVVLVVLAQLSEGGMDAKALAMLGVLSALNAALRPLGAGLGGIETVFFLLVLSGRVFGAGFGFVLGCTSLFASAFLTAGVGPWLPYQMLISAWIGLGAGLLPKRVTGRAEIAMLAAYGVVAAYVFGLLMNLSFWPFAAGAVGSQGPDDASLAFVVGGELGENLRRFISFTLLTSGGWDTGRAVTNAVAIAVLGPAILAVLRRAVRRASFGAPVTFDRAPVPYSADSSSSSESFESLSGSLSGSSGSTSSGSGATSVSSGRSE